MNDLPPYEFDEEDMEIINRRPLPNDFTWILGEYERARLLADDMEDIGTLKCMECLYHLNKQLERRLGSDIPLQP